MVLSLFSRSRFVPEIPAPSSFIIFLFILVPVVLCTSSHLTTSFVTRLSSSQIIVTMTQISDRSPAGRYSEPSSSDFNDSKTTKSKKKHTKKATKGKSSSGREGRHAPKAPVTTGPMKGQDSAHNGIDKDPKIQKALEDLRKLENLELEMRRMELGESQINVGWPSPLANGYAHVPNQQATPLGYPAYPQGSPAYPTGGTYPSYSQMHPGMTGTNSHGRAVDQRPSGISTQRAPASNYQGPTNRNHRR